MRPLIWPTFFFGQHVTTVAGGINAAGQIVGFYAVNPGATRGFLFTNGLYAPIDDPLGIATFATGINDAGQIVGFYNENNFIRHGFVHNPDDGTFTTLDDPLATGDTLASGINNMGQIVGYYVNASGTHGFLYSNGTYTTLDDPLGTTTEALGINDAGQIVGFYKDSGLEDHGFLLTITPNPAAPAGTTADMILRGSNTSSAVAGQYEIYDLGNKRNVVGQLVGPDWN
jgi:probable HAF family extracellular repeat protein